MQFDLIKYQKKQIFVSDEKIASSLTDFYVDHPSFLWEPNDGDQWIKVNFYETVDFDSIAFTWAGTIDSVSIEYSYDNINWFTVSAAFTPDNKTKSFDMDYLAASKVKTGSFLKVYVNGCASFSMDSFSVKTERSFSNTQFISHLVTSMYPTNQQETAPLFPSITRNLLEMYENKYNKDIRLFDSTLWSNVALSTSTTGTNPVVLNISASSDIPLDANMYIWDFDDTVDTYIQTKNPLSEVQHSYTTSGTYFVRLMVKYPKYQLEFIKKVILTVI